MRKGQEEIVGFVLIIIIASIVLLVFLGLTLRQDPVEKERIDVYQFLESSMYYTSDCALRFVPDYANVIELLKGCNSGSRCVDGRDSCEVVNITINEIIEESWQVGEDRPIKGYEFNSAYVTNNTQETILETMEGNCSSSLQGAEFLVPDYPGRIRTIFKVCY